jgi:hypothetical protein
MAHGQGDLSHGFAHQFFIIDDQNFRHVALLVSGCGLKDP